jgi:hypothetical protein
MVIKFEVLIPQTCHTTSFPLTGWSSDKPVTSTNTADSWSPARWWCHTSSIRVLAELSTLEYHRKHKHYFSCVLSGTKEINRSCIQRRSWRRGGAIPHKANEQAQPDRLQILTFLLHSLQDTLRANEYEMSLTFKSGGIEQSLGGKETATILIDPSMLKFHILCVAFRSLSRDSAPHLATSVFFQNLVSLKAVYTVSGFGWRQDPIMYNTEFSPMMTSGSHEIPLFTPLST